tara:strand:- start:1465 stop:2211 length:747 start_codon:yes stop_codon:yes gene_type:complete
MEQQKLAKRTIDNHKRNLGKLNIELLLGEELDLVNYILSNFDEGSPRKAMSGSVSKFRTFKKLPRDEIAKLLKISNEQAAEIQKKNNDALEIPDVKNVKSLMNLYLKQGMYKQYVVMYLLIHLQTRNLDLVAKVTHNLDDVDKENNWLFVRKDDVVFYRSKYKTSSTFGMKKNIIKSKRFHFAVSQVKEVLRPEENLYRSVMRITGQISESLMMKMSVCNNNNIKGIKTISKNRGTSMNTISTNYDCT